jgi:hypothetical protein
MKILFIASLLALLAAIGLAIFLGGNHDNHYDD